MKTLTIKPIKTYDVNKGGSFEFIISDDVELDYCYIDVYDKTNKNARLRHRQNGNSRIYEIPSKDDPTIEWRNKNAYVNGDMYRLTLVARTTSGETYVNNSELFYCFDTPSVDFINPTYGETVEVHVPAYTFSIDVKITYPEPALVSQANKVQKYEINLWNADTGEGTHESGWVLGTGTNTSSEVVGDKTIYTYNIKHTFYDLEPNISYRADIGILTETGMYKWADSDCRVEYSETIGTSMFRSVYNMSGRGSICVTGLDIGSHDIPDSVKILRSVLGEDKWMSLAVLPYKGYQTTLIDSTAENGVTYTYRPALIYNIGGVEYEILGIGEDAKCCFEGVILSDSESFIRLDTAIYTGMQVNQTTGIHNPLGSRHPIVVVNSNTNYHTGGVGGKVLNDSFGKRKSDGTYGDFDEYEAVKKRKEIDKFLTNKKPKILKDAFGTMFIVMITEAPTYEFEEWNSALATINFNYTEIGDANNPNDIMRIMGLGGVS